PKTFYYAHCVRYVMSVYFSFYPVYNMDAAVVSHPKTFYYGHNHTLFLVCRCGNIKGMCNVPFERKG
ncbi:MAG: hypothetical protein Q4D98_13735, partial [Planctomycetia bacterium]|nr:hypothetical protein [Planctomycetia bacterium]